jgi:hypothetical protein
MIDCPGLSRTSVLLISNSHVTGIIGITWNFKDKSVNTTLHAGTWPLGCFGSPFKILKEDKNSSSQILFVKWYWRCTFVSKTFYISHPIPKVRIYSMALILQDQGSNSVLPFSSMESYEVTNLAAVYCLTVNVKILSTSSRKFTEPAHL